MVAPNARPVNAGPRQAHIDPHTIVLPVVDESRMGFRRFSTEDGLSQTHINAILQDHQGFMWFASMYGLNRYDGYNFKVFKHEPGNPNSLSGVHNYSLFKDHSGMLWVGCEEFLDKFDPVGEDRKEEARHRGSVDGNLPRLPGDPCALGDGYQVYFASEVSGGITREAHEMDIQRMIQAGAVRLTWGVLSAEWQRDWAREVMVPGLSQIVVEHYGATGTSFL